MLVLGFALLFMLYCLRACFVVLHAVAMFGFGLLLFSVLPRCLL